MTISLAKPKRRWFRFSLRTLFLLVTVIACWLGWQVHVVQHRKAMLMQIEASGGYLFNCGEMGWGRNEDHTTKFVRPPDPTYRVSSNGVSSIRRN
jgi:hypothetical protein